jgi:hypothetical protein
MKHTFTFGSDDWAQTDDLLTARLFNCLYNFKGTLSLNVF